MNRAIAIIRKVGNQYCVFSEDGVKNLGCSKTREGAEKRLKQVEHFKNRGNISMAEYDKIFNNINLTEHPQTKNLVVREGTIAGHTSTHLLDQRDHFPVITETQARASMNRAMQLSDVPVWYHGTLDELRCEVYQGVMAAHSNLELKIPVPIEQIVALSDGEEESETKRSDLKNPEDKVKSKVPQAKRGTIANIITYIKAVQADELIETDATRRAFAGNLIEMLQKQKEHLDKAMSLAKRLMNKGMTGEEFAGLISFLQEDILRDLMIKETSTAQGGKDRRSKLMKRMKDKNKNSSYEK